MRLYFLTLFFVAFICGAKAKEKPDRIPLPNEKKEEKKIVKKKQNPEEVKPEIRQSSEFEKKKNY